MVVSVSHAGFGIPSAFFTKLSFFWWFFVFSVVGLVWWIGLSCRCGLLGCILRGAVLSCVLVIFSCSGSFFFFCVVVVWCCFFVVFFLFSFLFFVVSFLGLVFRCCCGVSSGCVFCVEILCCGACCVLL